MLSRVDERIGFMTPQQPIKLGANTDKVKVLWLINELDIVGLCTFVYRPFFILFLAYIEGECL